MSSQWEAPALDSELQEAIGRFTNGAGALRWIVDHGGLDRWRPWALNPPGHSSAGPAPDIGPTRVPLSATANPGVPTHAEPTAAEWAALTATAAATAALEPDDIGAILAAA